MSSAPDTPDAHRLRALQLRKRGQLEEAITELNAALKLDPNYAPAYFNIAMIRLDQNHADEAANNWRKAIELKPDYHQAYSLLGAALRRMGKLDEAIAACREAIRIKPDDADAHLGLATALHAAQQFPEAIAEFEHAIRLDPKNVNALNNFGNLLSLLDLPGRAAAYFRRAIDLDPNRAELYNNLANVLKAQAAIDQAIECYKRTIELNPDHSGMHSNLMLTLNCHPRAENGLLQDHLKWVERHARKLYPQNPSFPNDRDPNRRLRIGYVSPDFRRHSVAFFIERVLAAHDRDHFEVFSYSNVIREDPVTQRCRAASNQWRIITGLADERVDQMVREDQIDILIDLSGHTAHNRLLVFARKPAPVQATYLGYPNTTGLATMDWRLTDADSDPEGMTESHYTEKLLRLPNGFLCYRPSEDAPEPRDLSTSDPARIIFGSFNNFGKVSREMIAIWARILQAVPGSKLLLKAESLADPLIKKTTLAAFASHGAGPERIEMLGRELSFLKHLVTYHQVDIALDTFPYNGTTTTCEAMWMGVPVVTLAGKAHLSRVGLSLLNQMQLEQLVATSPDEYVSAATALAMDAPRRHEVSRSLRERMRASSIMDANKFTRALESAYRDMWKMWCDSPHEGT